jgi:hypothetical protein
MRLCAALATLLAFASIASAERKRVARAQAERPIEPTAVHAQADEKPLPPLPGVTLRQGVVAGHVAFEINATKDAEREPMSLAPDLAYGVTDNLTLGIIHSASALTGFRGSAGSGVCFTGTEGACRTPYTAGGIEALYNIGRGSAALALDAGIIWSAFEPSIHTDAKLGLKLKMSEGNVFAWFQPNVWLALDDRWDRVVPHEHQLFLPISVWIKPVAPLAIGVGSGVKGPLKNFGDRLAIPIGPLVQYAFDARLSAGASLVFSKVLAGNDVMNPGLDTRAVQVWINLSSR